MSARGFTFRGTDRFSVQRQLGAGTFGVVYLAYDRVRQERVALKVLKRIEPGRLYAFKREFRALADVVHENLVALYELVSEGQDWFFTMELVEGVPFLKYVRRRPKSLTDAADIATQQVADQGRRLIPAGSIPNAPRVLQPPKATPRYDDRRLRSAFSQLTAGILALHKSGQLHRDIKPSNAMVSEEGRVVLLDFGLVKEWGPDHSIDERVIGSVGYMSPEQGSGASLTPASDFYAVGAMLYQALTGRLPHVGDIFEVLVAKRNSDPPPPSHFDEAPPDLEALCMALLSREPSHRPDGHEVIRALGGGTRISVQNLAPTSEPEPPRLPFVGRENELGQLDEAFADMVDGRTIVVGIHGRSGMGKSALVNEYLVRIKRHATVLRGSCYERESVPHKALDNLMDALTRHLKQLSRLAAEQLMPREIRALARLFPVLDRVKAVAEFPHRSGEVNELQELRLRAVAALQELLARMSDHRPLVLCIDDVQWGDVDSVALLSDLLLTPAAPPLLLLLCYRSEETERSPFLEALLPQLRNGMGDCARDLEIGPLDADTGRDLALQLFDQPEAASDAAVQRLARQVAEEAGGSPFFIYELTEHLLSRDIQSLASSGLGVTLADVLTERLNKLSASARRLLDVIAVASRPIPESVAIEAAKIRGEAQSSAVQLRAGRFVQSSVSSGDVLIASYHDRIRETVLAGLGGDLLAGVHLDLALALEASDRPDSEALALHFHAAGKLTEAGHYATVAAEQAFLALAFDLATRLYQLAVDLAADPENEGALRERMAEALSYAGRGPEAARAYLAALPHVGADRALDLKCRAAQQLFFAGQMTAGTTLFNEVLEAAELPPIPKSDKGALFELVRRRMQLRLRGLDAPGRGRDTPRQRLRTDICYAVSAAFGGVRPITATSLQTHHLLLALELGEPYRLARGLGLEAIFASMSGSGAAERTRGLLERADSHASRSDRPEAAGIARASAGICAYFEGDWQRSADQLKIAEEMLAQGTGVSYELGQARGFLSLALFYLGDIAHAGQRVLPIVQDARTRGARHSESLLVNVTYRHFLFTDDIDSAREELTRTLTGWYDGFTVQDFEERSGRIRIALYCGDGDEAAALLQACWKSLQRSGLMRVQVIRAEMHQLRAQAALMRAAQRAPTRRTKLLQQARDNIKRVEDEGSRWCRAIAKLLRAAAADLRGETDRAAELLTQAERACDELHMAGFTAATRWQLAHLLGGERGTALLGQSEHWMAQQNIRNPQRFCQLLAPGFARSQG